MGYLGNQIDFGALRLYLPGGSLPGADHDLIQLPVLLFHAGIAGRGYGGEVPLADGADPLAELVDLPGTVQLYAAVNLHHQKGGRQQENDHDLIFKGEQIQHQQKNCKQGNQAVYCCLLQKAQLAPALPQTLYMPVQPACHPGGFHS